VEAYVHRIGRTGRAGRSGDAILFAANRERRLLAAIESATGNSIEKMELPTAKEVTDKRVGKFKQRITETLDTAELDIFRTLIHEYQLEHGVPVIEIAAALGALAQGGKPLQDKSAPAGKREEKHRGADRRSRADTPGQDRDTQREPPPSAAPRDPAGKPARNARRDKVDLEMGMERFRLEVGHIHGVKPGNIVGAIANEAEIDSEYIGRIEIFDDHSIIDLPEGMPKEIFKHLKSVWVAGQRLQISRVEPGAQESAGGFGKRPRTRAENEEAPAGKKRSGKNKPTGKTAPKSGVRRRPAK